MTNNVTILGRLTKTPELRFTPNGQANCRLTIAVNRPFKNKQTNEYEADFINCQAWGKTAEFIANNLDKGNRLSGTGRIQTGSYEKDNQRIYTTDVILENVVPIDWKDSNQQGVQQQTQQQYNPGQQQQQPLNQPMYGGNPNQPQGQFHTGGQAPQQSYQWSQQQQQQQQQPNYTRVDEDPFANSKGPTNQEIEDSLPF